MKHAFFVALVPLILAGAAMAQTPDRDTAAQFADAPLPPPCEAPMPRAPAPPGPPAPGPAPCRP